MAITERRRGVLVTDFDGTLTDIEFYQLVRDHCQTTDGMNYWAEWMAGRISHFEAMARYCAAAGTDRRQVEALADRLDPHPRFGEYVQKLAAIGWEVIVASAGCDWYIRQALRRFPVEVTIHANVGTWSDGKGIVLTPHTNPRFRDAEIGVSKAAIVQEAQTRADIVAFAGDGGGDVPAALAVDPAWRFAKHECAARLDRAQQRYQHFDRWSEVAERILHQGA